MLLLDEFTVVVYTPAELETAVSTDNGYDHVILGADILMTNGIRIESQKASLIIDGFYPQDDTGVVHSLTDTGANLGMLYINAVSGIDLTFQDLTIYGRNYYGMPRVYDIAGNENVTVTYRNVTYTGTQITWHPRGLVRYIDCDITITTTGYSAVNEVAELNRVEIGGRTVIRHTGSGFAVFYFYKANPSCTILAGANVEVSTAYDFLYHEGIYYVAFTIQPNAVFNLTTQRGISRGSGHRAASFLVDENATFNYIRQTGSGDTHALYMNGLFTVNSGATVYMQADFTNSGSLLRFMTTTSGLTVGNPKSVVFYNSGTASSAAAMSFGTTAQLDLTGGQVNYWTEARAFPIAGGLDDTPAHKWNRDNWAAFTLRGTANSSLTSITYNDFTPEEIAQLPPLSNMQLHQAKVFSIGNVSLLVNPMMSVETPVTGRTEADANVRIVYIAGGSPSDTEADDNGFFSVDAPVPAPMTDMISVFANTPFLIVFQEVFIADDGELGITYSPETISFNVVPISTSPYILLTRQDVDDYVTIYDTRAVKTDWVLWAKITGPLTNTEGETLENAVVFSDQIGNLLTLNSEPQMVHVGVSFPEEEKDITWEYNRGVLARITESVRSNSVYSTQLIWEVYPDGEVPPGD